jgi:sarcosine oxidase gamma subunit
MTVLTVDCDSRYLCAELSKRTNERKENFKVTKEDFQKVLENLYTAHARRKYKYVVEKIEATEVAAKRSTSVGTVEWFDPPQWYVIRQVPE